MAEHIRVCADCRAGRDCAMAVAIIGNYTGDELIEALAGTFEDRSHTSEHRRQYMQTYIREYMRAKRRKAKAAEHLKPKEGM